MESLPLSSDSEEGSLLPECKTQDSFQFHANRCRFVVRLHLCAGLEGVDLLLPGGYVTQLAAKNKLQSGLLTILEVV